MGNRLSRIYTRTGDDGTTGLGDGRRVSKADRRMEAIGTVDELNSQLGVLTALLRETALLSCLRQIQNDLFDLGGELSLPGEALVRASQVTWLEEQLDTLNTDLPPLKNFILPGGTLDASHCHLARAVSRRAERCLVILADEAPETTNPIGRQYLNRLSDFLFVLARTLARANGGEEVLWQAPPKPD